MTIRPARTDEGRTIVDILHRACATVAERFGLTPENCPRSPAFYTLQRVQADFERDVRYYLLEEGADARGCVALEKAKPDACYLERLAVLPECRGQGFGKALVTYALAQAQTLGVARVEIGIIAEDTRLADWYRQRGFVETDTKTFDHLPFTVGFMARQL